MSWSSSMRIGHCLGSPWDTCSLRCSFSQRVWSDERVFLPRLEGPGLTSPRPSAAAWGTRAFFPRHPAAAWGTTVYTLPTKKLLLLVFTRLPLLRRCCPFGAPLELIYHRVIGKFIMWKLLKIVLLWITTNMNTQHLNLMGQFRITPCKKPCCLLFCLHCFEGPCNGTCYLLRCNSTALGS